MQRTAERAEKGHAQANGGSGALAIFASRLVATCMNRLFASHSSVSCRRKLSISLAVVPCRAGGVDSVTSMRVGLVSCAVQAAYR